MNKSVLSFLLAVIVSFTSLYANSVDSLMRSAKKRKADFLITTRVHSTAHFPYTGSYINHHLNVDVNLFYERNNTGAFLFKSQDIEDRKSIINYLQPGVFKRFNARPNLQFTLFGGYLFSQTQGFSDKDSDVWSALVTSWKINDHFKIENTSLFFNLTKSELHSQLANRTVISALLLDFKFDLFVWHNVVFETNNQFTSAALAVSFPKIRITEKIKVQNIFSYQTYLTDNKPSYAMRNGFLFTMAVPFQISEQ